MLKYLSCPKEGVDLRPFAYWDGGLEFRRGHGCVSIVLGVVKVEVSVSGWSLVQSSPTDCGVSEIDREASIIRRLWPTKGSRAIEKKMCPNFCLWFSGLWRTSRTYDKKKSPLTRHIFIIYLVCLNSLLLYTTCLMDFRYYTIKKLFISW